MVIRNQDDLFLGQVLWLRPVFGKCFTSIPVSLVVPGGCVIFFFLCLNLLGGGVFCYILSSIQETANKVVGGKPQKETAIRYIPLKCICTEGTKFVGK